MRNKKEFIFNEKEYAEKIIEEGFENGILDYSKIYTVAKYFREQYGYGEKRLEKEIIEFCQKHDKNFNPVVEAGAIHKWVKSAMNYGLRKIEEVDISEKDIDFLKTIKNQKDRKALFIALVFSKSLKQASTRKNKKHHVTSNNYYVHYNNLLDIVRLIDSPSLTEMGLVKIFNKYPEHIIFLHPERELIKLEYVDKEPNKKIIIRDLNNLSGYYEKEFEDSPRCVVCGKKIEKKSNRQKTCPECSIIVRRQKEKERMRIKRQFG